MLAENEQGNTLAAVNKINSNKRLIPTAIFHKNVWIICEAALFEWSPTARVLAGCLQIYYGFYTPPLKLGNYILLYYLRGARPCHRKDIIGHPKIFKCSNILDRELGSHR